MWTWDCSVGLRLPDSDKPAIIWESHSEEGANKQLVAHVMGSDVLGIDPCFADHVLSDDGNPCLQPNCNRKYVRKEVV